MCQIPRNMESHLFGRVLHVRCSRVSTVVMQLTDTSSESCMHDPCMFQMPIHTAVSVVGVAIITTTCGSLHITVVPMVLFQGQGKPGRHLYRVSTSFSSSCSVKLGKQSRETTFGKKSPISFVSIGRPSIIFFDSLSGHSGVPVTPFWKVNFLSCSKSRVLCIDLFIIAYLSSQM